MDIEKVVEDYQLGMSLAKVAQVNNVNVHQVLKALQKSKVPTRSNRENSRRTTINHASLDKLNPTTAYWLGVVAADGHVAKYKHSSGQVVLTQKSSKENYEWITQFAKDFGSDQLPKEYTSSGYASVKYLRIVLKSDKLFDNFCRYGVVPKKSLILKPPTIDRKLFSHWVRGYFDGDGTASIRKSGSHYLGFCGTEEVLEWVEGLLPATKIAWGQRNQGKNNFDLRIYRKQDVMKTIDYLYDGANRWLPRKKERCYDIRRQYSA